MKAFCALLLAAFIVYAESSPHACDKFAADTYNKGNREHEDQVLPLDGILQRPKTRNLLTRTTHSSVAGSDSFCSAQSYGNGCEAVGHWRQIIGKPAPGQQVGADELRLKTVYVAVTGKGYAIKYEFVIRGVNEDDYIFQLDNSHPITATKIMHDGTTQNVSGSIPSGVLAKLRSEFALFYAGEDFALYMTCDASTMWVTYDVTAANDQQAIARTREDLEAHIALLNNRVTEAGMSPPGISSVNTIMEDVYANFIPSIES